MRVSSKIVQRMKNLKLLIVKNINIRCVIVITYDLSVLYSINHKQD